MKFKNIDGEVYVVLEPNDKLKVTTEPAFKDSKSVDIECQGGLLNISFNPSSIDTIGGNGKLERVVIPSILSTDEIIKQCDQWLEMFKEVHDKFRELVLTKMYRDQMITMTLSFCKFFSALDKNVKGRKIDLDLKHYGTKIKEGMTILVDEENEEVYKYLLARVLEYYLLVNCSETVIDNTDVNWNRTLYSDDDKKTADFNIPIICKLRVLYESMGYEELITSIITSHNLNQSLEQIIDNLKQRIYNQQMGERFCDSINRSIIQYGCIMSDFKKGAVRERKRS